MKPSSETQTYTIDGQPEAFSDIGDVMKLAYSIANDPSNPRPVDIKSHGVDSITDRPYVVTLTRIHPNPETNQTREEYV